MGPLTPPDCDLRAFPTMPLDAVRLFGSQFHAIASDGAWRAGVTLWLRSWHQVPAASLPDDDVQLARLAELGRDVKSWKKIRAHALHGWIACDDGRLYHPVISEMATAAWAKRKAFKERSAKGNGKRWAAQRENGDNPNGLLEGQQKDSSNDPKGEGEERDTSVDKSTEAEASFVDPDKAFWTNAKAYLKPHTKGDPGQLIGKWCRDFSKASAASAIGAAQVERAVDPVSYIERVLRGPTLAASNGEWVSPC
jgi:hypothetical protein